MKKSSSKSRHPARKKPTNSERAAARQAWTRKFQPPDLDGVPAEFLAAGLAPKDIKTLEVVVESKKFPKRTRQQIRDILEVAKQSSQQRSSEVGVPEWELMKVFGRWLLAPFRRRVSST